VSGSTNRIVTEIIIDADQAELSMAQLAAAQRAAQREFDKTTAKIMENTAATERAAEAGIDAADALTITAGALRKAKAESDAYLGRMDPLIFAHTSLSRELGKVGQAIKGVDTLLIAKKIKDDEAIARTKQLEMREKELITVMGRLEAGTIDVADAMAFMNTTAERLSKGVKEVAVDVDGLRAKLVPLEAQQKAFANAVAEVGFALDKEVISIDEAGDAYRRLYNSTSDAVKGMRDVEAHMADVEAAARTMRLGVIAASQMTLDPRVAPGSAPVARQTDNTLTITNPLYGAEKAKRQRELEETFAELGQLEAKYNPLTAALQKYQAAMAEVIADHGKLGSSAKVIETELAKLADEYYANVKAINELGTAHVDLDKLRASIDPLTAATQRYDKEIERLRAAEKLLPGESDLITAAIKRTTAAYDAEVVAIKKRDGVTVDTATGPTEAELNAKRAGFDRLFAAGEKYRATLTSIGEWEIHNTDQTVVADNARKQAAATYDREVAIINNTGKSHEELDQKVKNGTASVGQMKFATQQLTVQMSQFFSGIATGQPFMITLIQQGHQVADVMWASGISMKEMAGGALKMIGSGFALLVTPIGAAIAAFAAVAGAITAVGIAAESSMARVGRLEQSLSGSRVDYKEMATEAEEAAKILARTTSLSTEDARTASNALVKAMDFKGNRTDIVALAQDIEKLSLALGEDIPAASKRFAESMTSPSKAAEALIGRLDGFDTKLVESIHDLELAGKINDAFTLYLTRQRAALENTTKSVTDFERAGERLNKAFTVAGQGGKSFMEQMGSPVVRILGTIENAIAAVVEKLRDYNNEVAKRGGPTLGEFVTRGISPLFPGGLPASLYTSGIGGTGNRSTSTLSSRATPDEMVTLRTRSGVDYTVRKDLAPAFEGFVKDLEDTGYRIIEMSSYRPYATVRGTGQPSKHASGGAVDFNARTNQEGTEGDLGRERMLGFAAKWGLTSGYSFRTTDPMHVGVDGQNLEKTIKLINDLRIAREAANKAAAGTPERTSQALAQSLKGIDDLLKVDPNNVAYLQYRQDLTKQLSEAVPATEKLVRSIRQNIDAEISQGDAWKGGTDAAIQNTNRVKAIAEATQILGEKSKDLPATISLINSEFDELTRVTERKNAAEAAGTPQRTTEALERQKKAVEDLLRMDPNNVALQQSHQRLTKDIYESIPAFDAKIRKIKEDTDASNRMALAWQHGSEAAQIQANREKALVTVREEFGPENDKRIAAEAQINKLYDQQLESTRKLEAEQAANTPARRAEELTTRLKYAQQAAAANPASAALAQQAAALNKELYDSVPLIDLQVRAIREDTAANDALAASWEKGAVSAFHTEIANKALAEANKVYKEGSDDATKATAVLTLEMEKQAAAAARVTLNKANDTTRDEIAVVQLQTKTLGMNADARERVIQRLKDEQAVKNMAPGAEKEDAATRLALLDDLMRQNQALKNTEASVNSLSTAFTQAFDAIGNSITQAFISGQGAAVNWKNVMTAAAQQVLQAFLKLAFVGPFLNYLGVGPTQPTLDLALSGLFGGGAGAASGRVTDDTSGRSTNGIGGSLSSVGTSGAGFLADALGLKTGIGGSINSYLGGPGGSLFAVQGGGTIFGTPISGAGSLFGSGPLTAAGPGMSTLGGTLGGIGGGFVLGSLAGEGIQGARGTTGYAPEIGAAAGAIAGAIIGSIIPGVGTLIGGLIGGTLGGGAGGFIGPKKASPFSSTLLSLSDGRAQVGQTLGQGVDTDAERTQALTDVRNLNTYLDQTALKLTSLGEVGQLGTNSPHGFQDPSKFKDLASGFSQLRFSSDDPNLNKYLQGRGFEDSATLQKAITEYHTLVESTIPTLMNFGKTTGSVEAAVKELNDAFNAAVEGSKKYGLATEELTAAQAAGEAKIRDAANAQIRDFDTTLRIRRMQANGEDPRAIALASFDQGADQQRTAYKKQLVDMFGDAFTSTAYYADQMRQLEETLGAERVALVRQAAEQIIAAEKQIRYALEDLMVRLSNATPGDARGKELFAFDIKANRETQQFGDQLAEVYGQAYRTTQAYADQINLMERVHGAERAEIVRKYAEAITAAWKSLTRADEDFNIRINAATKSAGPYDDLNKELYSFDVRANRERQDFSDGMIASFGEAFRSTQAYADQMALEERTLGAERLAIIRKYNEQIEAAWKTVVTADEDLNARRVNAGSASAQDKELFSFDLSAARQRVAFRDQLIGLFGDSYTASRSYADQMSLLEVTLGEERLAIVKKYADEITAKSEAAAATAAGSITSLVAYAQGLQTSNASPLSPQDQLALARSRFNAVAGAAGAGDYTSIQQLQGYADTFLNASRAVFGSGEAYVSDFQRVLEALGAVANVAPDTVIASVLQVETRTQTAELVSSLADLKAAVDNITTQLRQNASAPARIAA
jgi:hypothetical protein